MALHIVFGDVMSVQFNAFPPQVLFQEVPDEVSLAFTVTGCPLKCRGCHSKDTWNPRVGTPLSDSVFTHYLNQYGDFVTCILFFGGEWNAPALQNKLLLAQQSGFKTCLYTGLDTVPPALKKYLSFLKTGKWVEQKGGLQNLNTNQRFLDLASNNLLNYKFQEKQSNVTS